MTRLRLINMKLLCDIKKIVEEKLSSAKSIRRRDWALAQSIIAILLIFFVFIYVNNADVTMVSLRILTAMGLIILVYSIVSLYIVNGTMFDYQIIFIILIYLFCNGQSFLLLFNVQDPNNSVFNVSNLQSIFVAQTYFTYCLIAYVAGSVFLISHFGKDKTSKITYLKKNYQEALTVISVAMIVFSVVPYIKDIVGALWISTTAGYENLYSLDVPSGYYPLINIISYLKTLFIPGCFLFMYSQLGKKVNIKIPALILASLILVNFMIGFRGNAIMIAVAGVMFFHLFIQNLTKKQLTRLIIVMLLFVLLIPTVDAFRLLPNKSFILFIDCFVGAASSNPIVSTIAELGYSMHSWILTYGIVPGKYSFGFGISYFSSFMMILPSFLYGGYSFANNAALDSWLQRVTGMEYGPGFNIFAETYYNFGWIGGIFCAFLLGLIFAKIFNFNFKDKLLDKLFRPFLLIFFYSIILLPRFPFILVVRNLVYLVVVPFALTLFISSSKFTKIREYLLRITHLNNKNKENNIC